MVPLLGAALGEWCQVCQASVNPLQISISSVQWRQPSLVIRIWLGAVQHWRGAIRKSTVSDHIITRYGLQSQEAATTLLAHQQGGLSLYPFSLSFIAPPEIGICCI